MTCHSISLALTLLVLAAQFAYSADEVNDALKAAAVAEVDFEVANDEAKKALIAAYQREIVKQSDAGKLDNVTRLTFGSKLFESDGYLMEPELEDDYKAYGKAGRAAREALLKNYRLAIVKLAATGRLEDVQEIQKKIQDRGLVSKLVSLQLTHKPRLYLLHGNYKGFVGEPQQHERLNATFEMVVGLSTDGIVRESAAKSGIQGRPSEIVSFRAVNAPGYYLAHGNNELVLQKYIPDTAFYQNASFKVQKGFTGSATVTFEAVNFPDHFLTTMADGFVRLEKRKPTGDFSLASTFKIVTPKFPLW